MDTEFKNNNIDEFWIEDQVYSWVKLSKEKEVITSTQENNNSENDKDSDDENIVVNEKKEDVVNFNTQTDFTHNSFVFDNQHGFSHTKKKKLSDNKIKILTNDNKEQTVEHSELSQFFKIKVKVVTNHKVLQREILCRVKDRVSDFRNTLKKNIKDQYYMHYIIFVNSEACTWENKSVLFNTLNQNKCDKTGNVLFTDNIQVLLIKDDDLQSVRLFNKVNYVATDIAYFNGVHCSREVYVFGFSLMGFKPNYSKDEPKELKGKVRFENGKRKETVTFTIKSDTLKQYSYFFEKPINVKLNEQQTMSVIEIEGEFYELKNQDEFLVGDDGTYFYLASENYNVFASQFYF